MLQGRGSVLLIVALLLTCRGLEPVLGGGNVGCLFNSELCEVREFCYDDNAFGRCVEIDDAEDDYYRHLLGSDTMQLLEEELIRLFSGGYRWTHDYTQCVVQNILYTRRHRVNYDPGLCSRILQMTSPPLPEEIEEELLTIEPQAMASIKFTPNQDSGGSEYADEIFIPPLVMEVNEKTLDKKSGAHPHSRMLPEKFSKKSFQIEPDTKNEDDAFSRYLAELAHDTRQLLDVYDDPSSRFPSKQINVIKTDLSSDMNHRPAFSEGGIEWVPLEKDNPAEKATSRVIFPGEYSNEKSDRDLEREQEIDAAIFGAVGQQKNLAASPDDNKRQSPKATNGKNTFEEDLDNWPFSESRRGHRDEKDEKDLFLFGNENKANYAISYNALDDITNEGLLPIFQRPMRYDIKKPGPKYYFPEDEVDKEAGRGMTIMQHLMEASRDEQLRDLLQPPHQEKENLISTTPAEDLTGDVGESQPKRNFHSPQQPEVIENSQNSQHNSNTDEDETADAARTGEGHLGRFDSVDATHAYILIREDNAGVQNGEDIVLKLEKLLKLPRGTFSNIRLDGQQITFKVNPNSRNLNASDIATKAEEFASQLKKATGLTIESVGIGDKVKYEVVNQNNDRRLFVLTFVLCGGVVAVLTAVAVAYVIRRHARSKEKLQNITQPDTEASQDYQDLCRQRMANKTNEKPEPVHAVQSPKKMRSLSQEGQVSSSSHSSTSSWNEEPVTSNMDISTGHMILSYMEDHLKNRDRLDREWEALCAYEAEPCSTNAASIPLNIKKNRCTGVLPYDHSRVILNELSNVSGSDYINASTITDHDPRNPAYIATQGPLPHTAADFWQMIWEQGSVVIVMLTRLMENGVANCHRYWPEEGSEVYHIYEVHLVSEHIWCDDYLVRSFYLKNLRTGETRTVTQFHFLSWPENGVPNSTKALLEFRRKVNKSYRGRSCPIVLHCSDGIGRTGTYCLIDMVLNRMAKGAKEIDIAATLEHVRDQRGGMVKTKAQFEFVLMAIAEEVHAILRALSQ